MALDKRFTDALLMFQTADFSQAGEIFEELSNDATDNQSRQTYLFNLASCLASSGDYSKALETLDKCSIKSNDLKFNKALCYYKTFQFERSLEFLDEIIIEYQEKYSELSIERSLYLPGSNDVATDENNISMKFQDSFIIEALNLKSAILFKTLENKLDAKRCLDNLPIKDIEQFDYVTLHNKAIYEAFDRKINPESSISKLAYLSSLNSGEHSKSSSLNSFVPKEVFFNQLKWYILTEKRDVALEHLRHFRSQIEKNVSNYELKFIEIILERQVMLSDELIYIKLDRFLDFLIKETKRGQIILNKLAFNVSKYEASLLWNNEQYELLEKFLIKVEPLFEKEQQTSLWNKFLGHALYMQDMRFEECVNIYENFLPNESSNDSLIDVDPTILGNLCVSYVLTGRNSNAEALIKSIEADEAYLNEENTSLLDKTSDLINLEQDNDEERFTNRKRNSHLSIINFNIGTLYCVKYNYEFGLSRIFKTLEPFEMKLNIQSWFVVKRCILSLIDSHCKQLICVKDDLFDQVIEFLIKCEKHGTLTDTMEPMMLFERVSRERDKIGQQRQQRELEQNLSVIIHGQNSVTYEARYLRSIILTVVHD